MTPYKPCIITFWSLLTSSYTAFVHCPKNARYLASLLLLFSLWLSGTSWTVEHQAPLFYAISWSLSNSCPLSLWCHPTISSSVIPFSSDLQSFPSSGSFQMSQFFASGDQSIGVSASASVFPMNIQDWFPLGWTDCISLLSKGLSAPQFGSINSSVFNCLYGLTLTFRHKYCKS